MRPLFQNNHLFKTLRPEKSGQNFVDSILKQNFLERFLFLHNVLKNALPAMPWRKIMISYTLGRKYRVMR